MLSVSPLLAVGLCAGLASAGCPDGWHEFGGNCYWRSDYKDMWPQADDACKLLGAHLASIHSAEENGFIVDTFNNKDSWIGYNDRAEEGNFVWSDGSDYSYHNWGHNEPNNAFGEDCTQMPDPDDPEGDQWDDADCGKLHKFICKMPATA